MPSFRASLNEEDPFIFFSSGLYSVYDELSSFLGARASEILWIVEQSLCGIFNLHGLYI